MAYLPPEIIARKRQIVCLYFTGCAKSAIKPQPSVLTSGQVGYNLKFTDGETAPISPLRAATKRLRGYFLSKALLSSDNYGRPAAHHIAARHRRKTLTVEIKDKKDANDVEKKRVSCLSVRSGFADMGAGKRTNACKWNRGCHGGLVVHRQFTLFFLRYLHHWFRQQARLTSRTYLL